MPTLQDAWVSKRGEPKKGGTKIGQSPPKFSLPNTKSFGGKRPSLATSDWQAPRCKALEQSKSNLDAKQGSSWHAYVGLSPNGLKSHKKGGRVLLLVRKERNHAHVVTLQTPGLGLHMYCTVS